MALETYRKKRNFDKTGEPAGDARPSGPSLRFVVQLHDASRLHYDFRLEWDGVLLSWAVPKGPSYNPKDKRLAVHVEDHPLEYRTFEGIIPEGEYGGGTVMVWDEGTWEPQVEMPAALENGSLKFYLSGQRLRGRWALVRMKPKAGDDNSWLLIKEKDEHVQPESGIETYDTSVVTGRTLREIAEADAVSDDLPAGPLPFSETEIMLAKLSDRVPGGDEWLHEIKFDGYRITCFVENGAARFMTRSGLDWTDKFKSIAGAIAVWDPGNIVVDGEMVVFDEAGRSDFQRLQAAMKDPSDHALHYVLFDCLAIGSTDLRKRPLLTRKALLEARVKDAPAEILFSFHQIGHGQTVFESACSANQEGIISKHVDAAYRAGRSDRWLKIKCDRRQEFVIGGYTTSVKSRTGLSSLLLGIHDDAGLTYVGRAGTGFTNDSAAELLQAFKSITRKTSPFAKEIPARRHETITYVKPAMLAEVRYAEMTDDGLLRHASFKGVRRDKLPENIVLETRKAKKASETVDGNLPRYGDITLTSPDKIVYPEAGLTKKDVADYYWAVKDRILPYLQNRPLTLIRCTDGIGDHCFFQKHMNHAISGMSEFPFTENDGDKAKAMIIKDAAGLIGAVQMGAVEFHVWGSAADHLETPDMLVFDLDPDEGMDIGDLRQGVRDLKGVLDDAGLISFLRTSGGKGYHIVVPLQPSADWPRVRDTAKSAADIMEAAWPDRYTSNMRKANRKGRIYIDWVRNGRGATSVSNFSLRSRPGAPIAWPLRWSDLAKILPADVTLANHRSYLKTLSGWSDFFAQPQSLKQTTEP
ncbi:MAG TPA: DNA ligase D [Clostridiaceae bacterium]|nr:DNA ligase D [Clostridiaceae bacterium]